MKKIIFIWLLGIVILVTGGIIYLNNVFLPRTIKALIIQGIEEQTDSKVTLESVRVNIFKGLVLKNLCIYKGETALLKVKEASCIFLPWSLLEKKIAIPIINLNSPQIFLERRKDNTLNLEDLFAPQENSDSGNAAIPESIPAAKAAPSTKKGFTVLLYKVNIANAKITFRDATFDPPYIKALENINIVVYLSLPSSVKFKLSGLIAASQPVNIGAYGEYKVVSRELNSRLTVNNFSPGDFAVYYASSGLKIAGLLNVASDLKMKDSILYADTQVQSKNLNVQQENISVKADTSSRVILEYGLSDKKLKISGSSKISNAIVSGVEFVDTLNALSCDLDFNNLGLSTENLTANLLGLPVKARLILSNFDNPAININANSSFGLVNLQAILKDKFKFNFPGTINGQGNLSLVMDGLLKEPGSLSFSGWLDLVDADVKLEKSGSPFQGINGRIAFTKDQAQWKDLTLTYQGIAYKTSGSLANFKSPLLDISLNSSTLASTSSLAFKDKLVNISRCSGRYFSSDFSIAGNIDLANPSRPYVALNGEILADLRDLNKILPKFKGQLDKLKPEGKVKAQFNLSGNINDPKTYAVNAQLSSDEISLYGLRGQNFLLNYTQLKGLASVESMRLSLYSGSLEAAFTVNLNSKDVPYWFTASLQGVEIKELKNDTLARNKDISGVIQGGVKASGFLSDLPNSQGAGKISITKGKLWELDLFKGMGKLLFSQEFANITFSEGTCAFIIQDRAISTDELMLKGNILNLSGPVRIGFDNSINAKLNVDIISELVPLSGTFKDITTAIVSQSGKFAVITVSGTLKEPKYRFQTAVTNILKGLADTFLKKL